MLLGWVDGWAFLVSWPRRGIGISAWRLGFLAWEVFLGVNGKVFLIFVCFVDLDPHFSVNNSDRFFVVFFEYRFSNLGSRFL
jgi:hypothetical protein